MLLGFLFFFGLFVAELAVIDHPADGGVGIGRNFDKVNAACAGEIESISEGKDTQLFAIHANDSDLAGTDFPVDPDERSGRRKTAWGVRATQDTLVG